MNTDLFNTMINFYNKESVADMYIFGIAYRKNIYMIVADNTVFEEVLKLDTASKGKGYSLRFKPNMGQRRKLFSKGANLICSAEMFNQLVAESKYNKGEIFEKLVTERFGQKWEKDSVPFYKDGDLTDNGIKYQIKFESSTLITERTMLEMMEGYYC